jgi:hypothetical protein
VHSDIAQEDNDICSQIADVLAVLMHGLGEPLTVISNYDDSARGVRLLRDLATAMHDNE